MKKIVKKSSRKAPARQYVVVRTYSAGVHVGYLVSRDGPEVVLADASRVWRWRGANTLHEIALRGAVQEYTRISERVPNITLTGAIEIICVSDVARENLLATRWAP